MSEALTGGYSSLAEAAGEYTPAVGWVPGVDFDPDNPEDMRAVELAWDREQAEMLVLPHDLARVLGGNAMACRFSSGEEGLVRLADAPFDPDSIAERRALETHMGVVPLTRDEISTLAFGQPVKVMGDAPFAVPGTMPVLVRLMTADELLAAHAESCRAFGQEPTMTREQAEELTRHL